MTLKFINFIFIHILLLFLTFQSLFSTEEYTFQLSRTVIRQDSDFTTMRFKNSKKVEGGKYQIGSVMRMKTSVGEESVLTIVYCHYR